MTSLNTPPFVFSNTDDTFNTDTEEITSITTRTTLLDFDGLKLDYDRTTIPKQFKISPNGINWTDGTSNHTTGLERLALVQTAFQAVELPPNATTLKLNDTILLTDGTTATYTMDNTGGIITETAGVFGVKTNTINKIGYEVREDDGLGHFQEVELQQDNLSFYFNQPSLGYDFELGLIASTGGGLCGFQHIDRSSTTSSNLTLSTNQNLVFTADNIDLASNGRLIVPTLASGNYLDYNPTNGITTLRQTTTGGVANPMITLNQNDTASGSANMTFYKNTFTNGSAIGELTFRAKTAISGNPEREYARIGSTIRSNTSGNVDGAINFQARINDTLTECMRINGQDSQIEIYQPLDLNDKDIVSSIGDIELNATSSAGNGKIILRPKEVSGTETISMPLTSSATDELVIEKSDNATTFYQVGGAVANTNAQMRLGYGGLRMVSINPSVAPTFGLDNTSFQTAQHQFIGTNYNLTLPSAGEVNLINANLDINSGSILTSSGNMNITSVGSVGTGDVNITAKNRAKLSANPSQAVVLEGNSIELNGSSLLSPSAGSISGQHLQVIVNGATYYIELRNP